MEQKRKMSPRSLANLKPPIRPGEVRNPAGINRKRPITDEYWQSSSEPMPTALIHRFNRKCGARLLQPGDTWARGVAIRGQYEAVMQGMMRAARELREAMEGKAEHAANGGHEYQPIVRWVGWYGLRRGAATFITKTDPSALAAKTLLRHRNLATTLTHYVKDDPAEAIRASEKMDAYYQRPTSAVVN